MLGYIQQHFTDLLCIVHEERTAAGSLTHSLNMTAFPEGRLINYRFLKNKKKRKVAYLCKTVRCFFRIAKSSLRCMKEYTWPVFLSVCVT